eukprot:gnl/MRDRNA2_/MRDRNA2_158113_c0_seq1.p1 gnl/MRDRNA2_/MRDRNA2_158113_c0~~gnl/MRDRNA2_/MRDRNA2_158113_c0_seq1.p1  ORF type:complete len:256 (+),score=45.78 gnl/MRDRNA2_/MRDRNA2_158113_c0_seq1:98-865(+)
MTSCDRCLRKLKVFFKKRRYQSVSDELYVERGCAHVAAGKIPICAFPEVDEAAIKRAELVVSAMLRSADQQVISRMLSCKCSVGIIGRNQKTTDLPPHSWLKFQETDDGRDYDQSTRGLGGTKSVPTTTVGEENVLMEDDSYFWEESILVHEFGHAVMNCGFDGWQQQSILNIYQDALAAGYSKQVYMFSNEDEFWANGTQAWFHAIHRTDINAGIKTRTDLSKHLPKLALLMKEVYGDGEWSYHADCPHPESWH